MSSTTENGTARIAIFASGRGSNAEKIIDYFKGHIEISVGLIVSNRKSAGVFEIAKTHNIPALHIPKHMLADPKHVLPKLEEYGIGFIALAGFLLLVPAYLTTAYAGRIVNIHPALLPKFGGKGMYGQHVHKAVQEAGERESGMTIHFVNPRYDEGHRIFQASVPLDPGDTAESIARKVLVLEHRYYAPVIERVIRESGLV